MKMQFVFVMETRSTILLNSDMQLLVKERVGIRIYAAQGIDKI